MKKLYAVLFAALLLFVSGCEKEPTVKPGPEPVTGGWAMQSLTPGALGENAEKAFEGVKSSLPEGTKPVSLIATQVVAGTNYCILTETEGQGCSLLYIYADLSGGYTLLKTEPLTPWITPEAVNLNTVSASDTAKSALRKDASADVAFEEAAEAPAAEPLAGGWQLNKDLPLLQDEKARSVYEKAAGTENEPVALLSTQVVAGMNYCFLVKTDTGLGYAIVYEDTEGHCSLTSKGALPLSAQ